MVRNEVPKLVHSYPKKLPLSAQFGIKKKKATDTLKVLQCQMYAFLLLVFIVTI